MIRIMVMNGLLISLILIWTSAAKEPSAGYLIKSSTKPPTGPLNYSVSKPMVSLHETNKEILRRKFLCGSELGGVCVNKKKSCPSNLPSEKSPGKPYCSKKKDRCCYPDPTTAAPPTVVPTTTTTSEDVNWSDIRNACIKSNNYKTYQPLTLDICKEKCVEEDAINCQSIEYSSAQQICAISEARSDSDDFIEPCFVDGWVFAEIELNAGPTTGAPTTLAPSNTTINGQTTNPPTTTAPSNTTNNVSSCNLVWNYEEDRPLIMIRETKTIVPPIIDIEISKDPNRIPEGKKLIFACPGENNQFNHVQGTHTKLHGECISHEQFKVCVNNYPEILDLSQLSCSSKMQPSIIKQDNDTSYEKSCEDIGGELYKFGYIYGDYREFKDLDTKFCFREKDQTTLWTSTNIDRIEISPSMRSMDPANFRTARGLAMNTFYSQKSQQETLKEILDKEVKSVWNDKACRNHGGHCVRGGRPCPKHLPHHTSQGEPFCTSFYRCCYSDQCDPTTCTYKGKKGNCSLDSLPGTTGVGSQECKKGCQCYIKDNKTLRQFESLQERMGNGEPKPKPSVKKRCDGEESCDPTTCTYATEIGTCGLNSLPGTTEVGNQECKEGCKCYIKDESSICEVENKYSQNISSALRTMSRMQGRTPPPSCNLFWYYTTKRPLIMMGNLVSQIVPPARVIKIGDDPNRIPSGVDLIFACPGINNHFNHANIPGTQTRLYGKCTSEDIFSVCINNKQVEMKLSQLSCSRKMYPSIIKTAITQAEMKSCNGVDGILYRIGYTYGDEIKKAFLYLGIKICFHKLHETTRWAYHTLAGKAISRSVGNNDPPDFRTEQDFFTVAMNTIYSQNSQQELFDKELGNKQNLFCELGKVTTLQKGHMAPAGDFVTQAEKDATYMFVNAQPQWSVINSQGGNWQVLEENIRDFSKGSGEVLKIFTGGYEVLAINTNEGLYLSNVYKTSWKQKKVPIPYGTWKVVVSVKQNKAVAFMVINYPFSSTATINNFKKGDRCQESNGLTITPGDYKKGLTYCFAVEDFRVVHPRSGLPPLGKVVEKNLLTFP